MLPDWPRLKDDLHEYFMRHLQARSAPHEGDLFPLRMIHEGQTLRLIRENGTEDVSKDTPHLEAQIFIKDDEMASLTVEELTRRVEDAAASLKRQGDQRRLEAMSEAAVNSGSVVDAKNARLSNDLLLQMLEKKFVHFDAAREPILRDAVVADPEGNLSPIDDTRWQELKQCPTSRARFDEIIARKYNEWCLREASRRLVG